MPKSGFSSVTIRDAVYELARGKAEKTGVKVSELTERAIKSYIASHEKLEDRARLVAEILRRVDEERDDDVTSNRQLRLLSGRVEERGPP